MSSMRLSGPGAGFAVVHHARYTSLSVPVWIGDVLFCALNMRMQEPKLDGYEQTLGSNRSSTVPMPDMRPAPPMR
jgi:hypothetical protein